MKSACDSASSHPRWHLGPWKEAFWASRDMMLARRLNPEPPEGVGKEGVGNSSTDLVSVQDWQPLLNPWLTLSKPDFARLPDSWIPVRKSPRKILHSELANCWPTLSQCIANSRPQKKLREPSLRRTFVATELKIFHWHSSKVFFIRPKFEEIKYFFTARICRGGHANFSGKKKTNKLKKNSQHTGRVSLGHPAGVRKGSTGRCFKDFLVLEKLTEEGIFCRETGWVFQAHRPGVPGTPHRPGGF